MNVEPHPNMVRCLPCFPRPSNHILWMLVPLTLADTPGSYVSSLERWDIVRKVVGWVLNLISYMPKGLDAANL